MNFKDFKEKDFLETDLPYKYIDENGKDPLEKAQLTVRVRMNAEMCGIKYFDELYAGYKKKKFEYEGRKW